MDIRSIFPTNSDVPDENDTKALEMTFMGIYRFKMHHFHSYKYSDHLHYGERDEKSKLMILHLESVLEILPRFRASDHTI